MLHGGMKITTTEIPERDATGHGLVLGVREMLMHWTMVTVAQSDDYIYKPMNQVF